MYKILETKTIQFMRCVKNEATSTIVFHFVAKSLHQPSDIRFYCIKISNGAGFGLRIVDDVIERYSVEIEDGYTDIVEALAENPTEIEAETYLLGVGVLPPEFV